MAVEIWLVRHGESEWNVSRIVQGQAMQAPGLTPAGRSQVEELAEGLRAELRECMRPVPGTEPASRVGAAGLEGVVPRVLSSDLARAVETAELLSGRLGVSFELDPRLRERSFGSHETSPISVLEEEHLGVRDGLVFDIDAASPGGESIRELYDRVRDVIGELQKWGRPVLVVSHGVFIRAALAYLDGRGPTGLTWEEMPNASWYRRPLVQGEGAL